MSMLSLNSLPDTCRVWIFPANRTLSESEQEILSRAVETGLDGWSAHGSAVTWGYAVVEGRFLTIAVNEEAAALTGCSIDDATRKLQALEYELNLVLLDNGRVTFEQSNQVVSVSRDEFREMAAAGRVDGDTQVYNTIVQTLGEQRSGQWKTKARDCWHAKAFPLPS